MAFEGQHRQTALLVAAATVVAAVAPDLGCSRFGSRSARHPGFYWQPGPMLKGRTIPSPSEITCVSGCSAPPMAIRLCG